MGKALLIMVAGSIFIFGLINLNVNKGVTDGTTNSVEYYASNQARNISNSTVHMALSKLADEPTWRAASPTKINFFDGNTSYKVEDAVYNYENVVKISATTNYFGTTKTTTAYVPPMGAGGAGTNVFNKAIWSNKEVKIKDGAQIISDDPSWNADVFSNQKVEIDNKSRVDGFITYGKEIKGNGLKSGVINPNNNPHGLPVARRTATEQNPFTFNADDYIAMATTVYPGDFKIENKTVTFGTKANPQIIYVGGKLELKKSVITGYVVFIVKKEIKIEDDVTLTSADPTGNNLALYSEKKVEIKDGAEVWGQIYGEKGVKVKESAIVHGSVVAGGKKAKVEIKKNATVSYRPPTASLTDPFFKTFRNTNFGMAKTRYQVINWLE